MTRVAPRNLTELVAFLRGHTDLWLWTDYSPTWERVRFDSWHGAYLCLCDEAGDEIKICVMPRLSLHTLLKFSPNCFAVENLSGQFAIYYGPVENA